MVSSFVPQLDLEHLCITILNINSLIVTINIFTMLSITVIITTSRSRALMLSWPALYHPLILGTFIPPNQNWSYEIVFVPWSCLKTPSSYPIFRSQGLNEAK